MWGGTVGSGRKGLSEGADADAEIAARLPKMTTNNLPQEVDAHAWAKPTALAVAGIALVLHLYEQGALAKSFSAGFLAWALVPYLVSLAVLARSRSAIPALCGVSVALALDLVAHYEVFIRASSSTSALLMVMVPLWSTVVFCPIAMLVAWLIVRRRHRREAAQ